jgi:hypothetical protein
LRKLTYWTYSNIELDDLIKPISELLNTTELIRDYENVWEWIQGESTELKSKINISREHNWKKGKFDKPLILTFEYRGLRKNKIIKKIGQTLVNFFERDINFGTIHILKNDEYEQKVERVFEPNEKLKRLKLIESNYDFNLPQKYKQFYLRCEKSIPENLIGTDLVNEYNELNVWANELLKEDSAEFEIGKDDFVFMMHQGYIFWYFKVNGNENPMVYGYYEEARVADKKMLLNDFLKEYIN